MQNEKERNLIIRKCAEQDLTHIATYIENFDSMSSDLTSVSLRLDRLEKVENNFDEAHTAILISFRDDEEQLIQEEIKRQQFQDRLFAVKVTGRKLLESNKLSSQEAPTTAIQQAALPKINIKPFEGKLENWRTFKNMFGSLVAKNPQLSDAQKLHHLNTLVVGEAAIEIESLEITDANFQVAWTALTERYDDKRAIVKTHLHALFDCPVATRSLDSQRNVISIFKQNINALKALDTEADPLDIKSAILVYLMTQKMDIHARTEWEISTANQPDFPTVESLLSFYTRRCQGLGRSVADNFTTVSAVKRKAATALPTATTSFATTVVRDQKPFKRSRMTCNFCNTPNHFIGKCTQFLPLTLEERNKRIRELKLCSNCLHKGCKPSICKGRKCRSCQRSHHTLLHMDHPYIATTTENNLGTSVPQGMSTLVLTDSHNIPVCTVASLLLDHSSVPSSSITYAIAAVSNSKSCVTSNITLGVASATAVDAHKNSTRSATVDPIKGYRVSAASNIPLGVASATAANPSGISPDINSEVTMHTNDESIMNHAIMSTFSLKNKLIDADKQSTTFIASGLNSTLLSQGVHCLLATATVLVHSASRWVELRVLLDSGSQMHYISYRAAIALKLPFKREYCQVQGIGNISTNLDLSVSLEFKSRTTNYNAKIQCLVLDCITSDIPTSFVSLKNWNIPANLELADPQFNIPSAVDMLLGVELFWDIFKPKGAYKLGLGLPYLRESMLGWVVSGAVQSLKYQNHYYALFSQQYHEQLNEILEKFWRLEHCPLAPLWTKEEETCEQYFNDTTTRNADGRYIVRLPLKGEVSSLGASYNRALKRFLYLENRLNTNPTLRQGYVEFMTKYSALGHMTQVPDNMLHTKPSYYIPHHAVCKETSSSTKLRVVYDASMKTDSGTSLNDILMVGPTIQLDLFAIILRFRTHKFAFVSDITQMYRQILVHSDDTSLQRIFWRSSPNEKLQVYNLNTVTYGTACAPFLATRCIKQLASDIGDQYPLAKSVLLNDFYMDDVLSGGESIEHTLLIQSQLIQALKTAGFQLSKWCSNTPELLNLIPIEHRESQFPLATEDKMAIKTLGLLWLPIPDDSFQVWLHLNQIESTTTKRTILASIASIFEPIGFLSPCIVTLKLFMKQLWQLKLNWDDPLPDLLFHKWQKLAKSLSALNTVVIPRRVLGDSVSSVQLHGFADSSFEAYGAVLYLRSVSATNKVTIRLLCAKSRIAPVKFMTIARLELCAALLLSELIKKVRPVLDIVPEKTYLWSDSTIVLEYLKSPSQRWKTFVANRVQMIQDITYDCDWRHVPTISNPADILSRGSSPDQLKTNTLWWNGPNFLSLNQDSWPNINSTVKIDQLSCEIKKPKVKVYTTLLGTSIFSKYSDKNKLLRVVAYIHRFMHNSRLGNKLKHVGPLTSHELIKASIQLLKLAQQNSFSTEINDLRKKGKISNKSSLLSLNPFICSEGLLRVGGRLQLSNLNFNQKHPIILAPYHSFTTLIIKSEHLRLLHAGPQLLLASLRQTYWILRAKDAIRKCTLHCITCIRAKASTGSQLMGSLPRARIIPSSAFKVTGIDFAGPFEAKVMGTRAKTTHKAYIALFVCFSTKAIHLELVSDLTTPTFLAAFDRFVGRRGIPSKVYSDNGTTFVGAHNQLQHYRKLVDINKQITQHTLKHNIQWSFSPPDGPHFGGLWEAGVKSVKTHLVKVLGNYPYNFEEFNTILIQIEACLNSRPLTPLSNDPNDLNVLTPGHFLIGEPLTALPHPDYTEEPKNRLKRWNQIQQSVQLIWKRWSLEYLNTLQQRFKWRVIKQELQLGDFVLIRDAGLPPTKWKMGRITDLHAGPDGLVRVVTIHTSTGDYKRTITRLVYLPIEKP